MKFNNEFLAESVDSIDAAIFTGDCMFDADDRKEFRRFLERWDKATEDDKWVKPEEKPPRKEKIFNSSNVEKIMWDDNNLYVHFTNLSVYKYSDVPENVSIKASNAKSIGSFLNREVKGTYSYKRIK
jgi:hypothetical protein